MKQFEDVNNSSKNTIIKKPDKIPKTQSLIEDEFKTGDIVILKDKFKNYSTEYLSLTGKELKVERYYSNNLGDMIITFLHLENVNDNNYKINNPYIAEHFKIKI